MVMSKIKNMALLALVADHHSTLFDLTSSKPHGI